MVDLIIYIYIIYIYIYIYIYHWHVHKHMQRITDVTNQVKLCSIFSVLETCVLPAQKRRSQKEWQRWPGSKQLSWCGPPCFHIWIETKVLLALGSCFRVGRTCCRWTASSYFGRKNGTYLGAVSVSLQHVQGHWNSLTMKGRPKGHTVRCQAKFCFPP